MLSVGANAGAGPINPTFTYTYPHQTHHHHGTTSHPPREATRLAGYTARVTRLEASLDALQRAAAAHGAQKTQRQQGGGGGGGGKVEERDGVIEFIGVPVVTPLPPAAAAAAAGGGGGPEEGGAAAAVDGALGCVCGL